MMTGAAQHIQSTTRSVSMQTWQHVCRRAHRGGAGGQGWVFVLAAGGQQWRGERGRGNISALWHRTNMSERACKTVESQAETPPSRAGRGRGCALAAAAQDVRRGAGRADARGPAHDALQCSHPTGAAPMQPAGRALPAHAIPLSSADACHTGVPPPPSHPPFSQPGRYHRATDGACVCVCGRRKEPCPAGQSLCGIINQGCTICLRQNMKAHLSVWGSVKLRIARATSQVRHQVRHSNSAAADGGGCGRLAHRPALSQ
jgi:hypothetical protein